VKQVAHEGQAPGPWRVVSGAPAFEEVSKKQKDDSSQQERPEMERRPEGGHQGAHRRQHGFEDRWLFCGLNTKLSLSVTT
jgi:hypothetical protein